MAERSRVFDESRFEDFKFLEFIGELLQPLNSVGTQRDEVGNREFFCDDSVARCQIVFRRAGVGQPTPSRKCVTVFRMVRSVTIKAATAACGVAQTSTTRSFYDFDVRLAEQGRFAFKKLSSTDFPKASADWQVRERCRIFLGSDPATFMIEDGKLTPAAK